MKKSQINNFRNEIHSTAITKSFYLLDTFAKENFEDVLERAKKIHPQVYWRTMVDVKRE